MDDELRGAAFQDSLELVRQLYELKRQADLIAELPENERRIASDIGQAHWHPVIFERVRAVIDPFGESLDKLRRGIVTSPDKDGSGCLARSIEAAFSLIEESLPSDRREQFTFGDRTEFSATETILRAAEDVCNILPDQTSPPEHKAAWQMLHGWIIPTQKMTESAVRDEFQSTPAGQPDARTPPEFADMFIKNEDCRPLFTADGIKEAIQEISRLPWFVAGNTQQLRGVQQVRRNGSDHGESTDGQPDGVDDRPNETAPAQGVEANEVLFGWPEILAAVKRPDERKEHERIKRLNGESDGPIRVPQGKGTQPEVAKAELIRWWNERKNSYQESAEEAALKDAELAANLKAEHNYGRAATVLPEISGSKRKRKVTKGND